MHKGQLLIGNTILSVSITEFKVFLRAPMEKEKVRESMQRKIKALLLASQR